jgi:hypothetical protein
VSDKGQSGQSLKANSLLAVRSWLQPSLLRLAPGWVAIAAAVGSGGLSLRREDLLQLLLIVLLADAAAGQLWEVLVSRSTVPSEALREDGSREPGIPYARPDSLAARLGKWLAQPSGETPGLGVSALSHLVAAVASVAVLSVALGPQSMAAAAGWLVLAVGARLLRTSERAQLLALSVYEVGLPWLLGYLAFWDGVWSVLAMALGTVLVLLYCSLMRQEESRSTRWAVRLAQAAMLACPVIARQPVATVIVAAALLVPVALQVNVRWRKSDLPWRDYRRATQVWWWLAMASAAWSVGTISGLAI